MQVGEESKSVGVLSNLTGSGAMLLFLKWLHQGIVQAFWQWRNTRDETKTMKIYISCAWIYPSSPIKTN